MKALPLSAQTSLAQLSLMRRSAPSPAAPESGPSDQVSLGNAAPLARSAPLTAAREVTSRRDTAALAQSGDQAAHGAASGGLWGGLWGAAMAICKPFQSALKTGKFAMSFLGKMRTRADEITHKQDQVQAHLRGVGMQHAYVPPKNHANVAFEGKMVIKASMKEFFELWDSWISQGYGSINDRQYADLVKQNCEGAKDNPLLAYVPMVSEDAFSAVVKDGHMQWMKETTTSKFAGLVPTSRVDWLYRNQGTPQASNSFEHCIDVHNGDLEAVQKFYQNLFDPKRVNPDSKATVEFVITPRKDLPDPPASGLEFEHSVHVPLGGLLSKPATTIACQATPASGPVAALALREAGR